jgi:hypothetical protein
MSLYTDLGLAWSGGQRQAAQQRDASLAMNSYARFLSQKRGNRAAFDTNVAGTKGLGQLASSYAKRGLSNSGIRSAGVQEYGDKWQRQQQDIQQGMAEEQMGYDLEDAASIAEYENMIQNLNREKEMRILEAAAMLEKFRPFLGS